MLHNVSREIHRVYVWIYFACQFAVLFTRYTAFLLIWRKNNKTPRISDVGDFGLFCAAEAGKFNGFTLYFLGLGADLTWLSPDFASFRFLFEVSGVDASFSG